MITKGKGWFCPKMGDCPKMGRGFRQAFDWAHTEVSACYYEQFFWIFALVWSLFGITHPLQHISLRTPFLAFAKLVPLLKLRRHADSGAKSRGEFFLRGFYGLFVCGTKVILWMSKQDWYQLKIDWNLNCYSIESADTCTFSDYAPTIKKGVLG